MQFSCFRFRCMDGNPNLPRCGSLLLCCCYAACGAKNPYPAKTQTPVHKRWSDQKRWFRSRSLRSNLIGFVIENLSYNWSIIIYRNSNTNSVGVFHCIKLIYGTLQRRGTCEKQGLCFCWIRSSSLERSVDKFDTMKNFYRICI